MNNINQNVISEARILHDYLCNATDPVENELYRNLHGIVGLVFMQGGAGSIFLDAATDQAKLSKLRDKLIRLENVTLDKNSSDYEKALNAHAFQKNVYEAINDYTSTIQKIKLRVGAGFFLNRFFSSKVGLLVILSSAAYGTYHWAVERKKLIDRFNEVWPKEPSPVEVVAKETPAPLSV